MSSALQQARFPQIKSSSFDQSFPPAAACLICWRSGIARKGAGHCSQSSQSEEARWTIKRPHNSGNIQPPAVALHLSHKDSIVLQVVVRDAPVLLWPTPDLQGRVCHGCLRMLGPAPEKCPSCGVALYCHPACRATAAQQAGMHSPLTCRMMQLARGLPVEPEVADPLQFLMQLMGLQAAAASDGGRTALFGLWLACPLRRSMQLGAP